MTTVVCVLHDERKVLLTRESLDPGAGVLKLIGGPVKPGESAIQACVREIEAATRLRVMPSCAGLFFAADLGHVQDYGLAFVADASGLAAPPDLPLEWVGLEDLGSRSDLNPVDRELIPRLLATDHPLAIVIAPNLDSQPARMQIITAAPIDGATLSPLVFAEQPGPPTGG